MVKDYVSKWKVDVVSNLSRDWGIMLTLGTRSSHLIAAAYPVTSTIEQSVLRSGMYLRFRKLQLSYSVLRDEYSHYAATDPKAPPTYTLTTTSLPRKYTFLLDLPLTSLSFSWRIFKALFTPVNVMDDGYESKALVASTWNMYFKTRRAFGSHESQYSWDRNLYMIASRYVWFNDLRKVERQRPT